MADVLFLPWERPLIPSAVEELARRFGTDGALDLSGTLVVLPGARGGRRLLELLVDWAGTEGRSLVPPHRILTPGALPEELYRPPIPLASGAESRRSWSRALELVPPQVVRQLFGEEALESDTIVKVGLARTLHSLARAVGAAAITFREVARECRSGFLFSDEERWEALARVQEEALRVLREAGRMDPGEARRLAIRDGALACHRTIVLVGVAEMPLVVRRMLEGVSDPVLSLVHAPEALADRFDALGTLRNEQWEDWDVPLSDQDLVVADGPGGQASEVIRYLMGLEGEFPAEEISIGVPDPSIIPFLAQQLEAHGQPSRPAEGSPLARTAPIQLLRGVADYLSGRRFEALASLLRHPDLPGSLDPESAPAVADAYFEDHLPDRLPMGDLPGGRASGGLSKIREALHGPGFLGPLEGKRTLSDWMPAILAFLSRVYGEAPLDPAIPEHGRLLDALLLIREGAEALFHLPPSLDQECTSSEALSVLLMEIRDGRIPPRAKEEALELVGWLELHTDDAPVLILTGVSDLFLPEAVNSDPFLPNALRARLGLEDNQSRYARDAYRLTAILTSRSRTLVVAGRRTAKGDPLRPSRLLLTGAPETVSRRIFRFSAVDDSPPEARVLPAPDLQDRGESRFLLPPEPHIPLPELPRSLPITAFRALLADPYQWALETLLGLREPSDDHQEMDGRRFGTLAHTVLERFGRSTEASNPDPEAVQDRLGKLLDVASKEFFGSSPLSAIPLQVEQLRTRLEAFALWQAHRIASGWRIHAVEARTPPGGVPFEVDGDPVFLSGRVDRIDRHQETGNWMVFDYKTGEGGGDPRKARTRDGRWTDLQLPLYRHVLPSLITEGDSPLTPPDPGVDVGLAYLPLSKESGAIRETVAGWTATELEDAYETARCVVRKLRETRGISFDPGRSGRKAQGGLAELMGRGLLLEEEGEG
ncbi:PD-(D/E)XK nuclease family protein [Gemmatimonadota bacterium]